MSSDVPFEVLTTSLMNLHAFMWLEGLPEEIGDHAREIERILLGEIFKVEPQDWTQLDHKNRVLAYLQQRDHPDVDDWLMRLADDAGRLAED